LSVKSHNINNSKLSMDKFLLTIWCVNRGGAIEPPFTITTIENYIGWVPKRTVLVAFLCKRIYTFGEFYIKM
jgi:hypothetical protein